MAQLEKQYHEELKKEVTGSAVDDVAAAAPMVEEGEGEESVPDAAQIAQDTADMPTLMMSRNKRKLYDAMKVPFNISPFIMSLTPIAYLFVFV